MVRFRRVATITGVVTALGIGGLAAYWLQPDRPSTTMKSERVAEAEARADDPAVLVLLEPGTRVDTTAPPGWSNLVIKSILHLSSGDVATLPASAKHTATLFRTVVLADVRERSGGQGGFQLRRVGAGLSLLHDGAEIVVNSASLKKLGVELGTLDGLVLARAERALGRGRFIAETPTFAVYESPVEFADDGGKHRSILLRYAIVVDPETGKLRTACWSIDESPTRREAPATLRLLPDSLVFECGIHVAARKAVGVSYAWGFAMTELPTGKSLPMPGELAEWSTRNPANEDEMKRMERAVRDAIK